MQAVRRAVRVGEPQQGEKLVLVLLSILYYALIVASGVCSIIIIVSAFQSEGIGKGIFILICGFYFIYYSLIDFEHDFLVYC